jgi:hypothetical protein
MVGLKTAWQTLRKEPSGRSRRLSRALGLEAAGKQISDICITLCLSGGI